MRFLLEPEAPASLEDVRAAAGLARRAGLDGLLIRRTSALRAPLVVVAAVAAAVPDLLLAAEIAVGDRHPLEVIEEAVVVDHAARGRLIAVLAPAPGCEARFHEAVDLVQAGSTPRPFSSEGPAWPVPAGLADNRPRETRVRVTPAPFGPTLSLWLAGVPPLAAARRGLGHLASPGAADAALARAWADAPPAGRFVPRARRETATRPDELLDGLRRGRASFGQDWAVVVGGEDAAVAAGHARPRLQLGELPAGLDEFWRTPPSERTVG